MNKVNLKKPFFFDGAFGTYYTKLIQSDKYCEYANIDDKETVLKIHKEYILSGADAIKTNTYGINSSLSESKSKIEKLISAACDIAKEAVLRTDVEIFADIGHISSEDSSEEEYIEIADIFLKNEITNFLFETYPEFDCLLPVLKHIKSKKKNSFIIVSFAVLQDGYTKLGHDYRSLIEKSISSNLIEVTGLNCLCGPTHLYELFKAIDLTKARFSAMPNAGYPSYMNGRTFYEDNTEYFSQKIEELAELGIDILGGCCGTTPVHLKEAIDRINKNERKESVKNVVKKVRKNEIKENLFIKRLNEDKKVIAVEINPPIDTDFSYILKAVKVAKEEGADIITVTDSPIARTRADSIMISSKIYREVGIEVLPHLTCRDKNHIGIKASLLAAKIENIDNVLAITGDPIALGERNEVKGVFNFNSFNLISYIKSLNNDVFINDPFYIGAALNINASSFEIEIKRAKKKIENGAKFFMTQPVFSDEAIKNLKKAKKELKAKIITGILPVAGYKNAVFLKNEVFGIDIPDELIKKLENKTSEEIFKISMENSIEMIDKTYEYSDGYYLIPPLKKVAFIKELIRHIKQL